MSARVDDGCGIIYVAAGESFVDEARISAESVTERCPDVPVTLFTDVDCSPPEFDEVRDIPDPNFGFADKIESMLRSPYDRTLYIDCDTYLWDADGVYHLFDVLEGFDVAGSHDTARTQTASASLEDAYDEGVPESFPMYQGGLLAFRSDPEVDEMLRTWLSLYRDHLSVDDSATDQEALRTALYESDLRIATLPPEYNFRVPYPQLVDGKVRLLHGRAANFEEIATAVNENWDSHRSRMYVPVHVGVRGLTERYEPVTPLVNPGQTKVRAVALWMSLQQYGAPRTLAHLLLGGGETGRMRYGALRDSLEERGVVGTGGSLVRWLRTGEFTD